MGTSEENDNLPSVEYFECGESLGQELQAILRTYGIEGTRALRIELFTAYLEGGSACLDDAWFAYIERKYGNHREDPARVLQVTPEQWSRIKKTHKFTDEQRQLLWEECRLSKLPFKWKCLATMLQHNLPGCMRASCVLWHTVF